MAEKEIGSLGCARIGKIAEKGIGFLGCGKIGKTMVDHLRKQRKYNVSFVQDIFFAPEDGDDFPVVTEINEALLEQTKLAVECANSDVLKANLEFYLRYCDVMTFSVTAFSNAEFENHIRDIGRHTGKRIFIPHGAILGIDGIFDGRNIFSDVHITTIKNPDSLNRDDIIKRTIIYDGPAREACRLYPKNVNVHATLALAGIGFDRTRSTIICDPAVNTNSHKIEVDGNGVHFELCISSFTTGGVTGKYTPLSACGSLDRVLNEGVGAIRFV